MWLTFLLSNRQETLECEEAIHGLNKAVTNCQSELLKTEQEIQRQSDLFLTEKTTLEMRNTDFQRDRNQLDS